MGSEGHSTQEIAESVRPSSETRSELAEGVGVKKTTPLVVGEAEWIELHRLLIDDATAALEWIKRHLGSKTLRVLEGGRRIQLKVPGAGIASPPNDGERRRHRLLRDTLNGK